MSKNLNAINGTNELINELDIALDKVTREFEKIDRAALSDSDSLNFYDDAFSDIYYGITNLMKQLQAGMVNLRTNERENEE